MCLVILASPKTEQMQTNIKEASWHYPCGLCFPCLLHSAELGTSCRYEGNTCTLAIPRSSEERCHSIKVSPISLAPSLGCQSVNLCHKHGLTWWQLPWFWFFSPQILLSHWERGVRKTRVPSTILCSTKFWTQDLMQARHLLHYCVTSVIQEDSFKNFKVRGAVR